MRALKITLAACTAIALLTSCGTDSSANLAAAACDAIADAATAAEADAVLDDAIAAGRSEGLSPQEVGAQLRETCPDALTASRQLERPRATPPPDPHATVTYEIDGTADSVTVTYTNAQGGTEQGDYRLPFRQNFRMVRESFAYISAQNRGDRGSVTCTILVDGKPFKTSTSEGAYVITDCSGSIP